jgi:hypothetical protein
MTDVDDRPIKRQRLNGSNLTSALRGSRSETPMPNDSNQDANIPDIVPSLRSPFIEEIDDVSIVGDEDGSSGDGEDDDESVEQKLESRINGRDLGGNYSQRSSAEQSRIASHDHGASLHEEFDEFASDHDPQKASRRLPGRRRAPVSDAHLEASLRRQLELRIGHRALSKALKPILLELAARTTEQLDEEENEDMLHETAQELAFELRLRLNARLQTLENGLQITTAHQNCMQQQDEQYIRMRFTVSLENDNQVTH